MRPEEHLAAVLAAEAAGQQTEARYRLGDPLVDRYLEFVADRARPNTLRAVAFDLKTFFMVVGKDPVAVAARQRAWVRADRVVSGRTCRWRPG